ncbi:MAG: dTDP-4-dehydrorhamnose reductase [Planctomycetota bacterium]
MSETTTVVLGAAGMLGSECVRQAPAGVRAIAADLAETDITKLDSLFAFLRTSKPRIVINCAAYTAVDPAENDRASAFRINSDGARNLAIVCRELGIRLLHISTDFVFDGTAKRPYAEFDITNPRGAYAESKHRGELAIQEIGGDWQIVRTQWLYGARGKHFVGTIAKLAKERERLTVVGDQHGCPTCTHDLAPHLWRIAMDGDGGMYHASSNGECSWQEFAAEIVKCAGLTTVVDPITTDDWNRMKPGSAPRPAYSVLAKLHLERTVGSRFPHWREALAGFFSRGDLNQ